MENVIGNRYGKLIVIEDVERHIGQNEQKSRIVLCECECGNKKRFRLSNLNGAYGAKSCGCIRFKKQDDIVDISGNTYNRLTAIRFVRFDIKVGKRQKYSKEMWEFLCFCGNTKIADRALVIRNKVKSCGCLKKEFLNSLKEDLIGRGIKNNALPYGVAAMNHYFSRYKSASKERSLQWNLSMDEFTNIVYQKCYYCGVEPYKEFPGPSYESRKRKTGIIIVNGIDRVDNTSGYTKENSVPCCAICNRSKMDLTYEQWGSWLDRIASYRQKPREELTKFPSTKDKIC